MGDFDSIRAERECPVCGSVGDWEGQTKNLTDAPFRATYRTGDEVVWAEKLTDARFTLDTTCPSCGADAGMRVTVIDCRISGVEIVESE